MRRKLPSQLSPAFLRCLSNSTVWHLRLALSSTVPIYVLYSTTTVLYVYFVPYVQYTVPVLSYYTNRVRPCHPICRLALLPVIFFVQLYSTVVLYTGIPYRLVLYISAFYVAQANEPVSIYAQNLRCTCNSMPLRDENDGTINNTVPFFRTWVRIGIHCQV